MVTKTTAEGAAKNIIDDLVEVFTLKMMKLLLEEQL